MLTTKENGLLKDLKDQEELCIGKYEEYASKAKSEELRQLFTSLAKTERTHLETLDKILKGETPTMPSSIENSNNEYCGKANYQSDADKQADAFLCRDMLATEKHASGLYDTCVFEFASPENRRTLNHIQAEEQQHGEKLYTFMNNNGMYN